MLVAIALLATCPYAAGQEVRLPEGWEALTDVGSGPIQEHGVAELNGAIYNIGGIDRLLQTVPTVSRYNLTTREWRTAKEMPTGIHHPNVASVGGRIYVLGGLETLAFSDLDVAYVYDPSADEWSEITPMGPNATRGASGVAVVDKQIYIIGGMRETKAVTMLSMYDITTDEWNHMLPPIPGLPRDHLIGAAIDGKVFSVAGRDTQVLKVTDELLMYDPQTREWVEKSPLPTARAGIAGGVVDGRIVVVGGEGNVEFESGVFNEVEIYDPEKDEWIDAGEMAVPRHGMGAASVNGKLYVPGGATLALLSAVADFDRYSPPVRA